MLILSLPPSQIGEEMYQMLSMAKPKVPRMCFALLDNLFEVDKKSDLVN